MLVRGFLNNSYQTKLDVDGFEYIADRSVEKGGENRGTSPHGLLVSSVAACKTMVAKGYLNHNKLPFEKIEVEAESEINGRPRNEIIAITVNLKIIGAELNEKEFDYLTRIVEKGCTMANILTAGGKNTVDLNIEIE